MVELTDDGSDFAALLGGFGTHANKQKRHKAERLAMLKPGDRRRSPHRPKTRPHQFNVRIDDETLRLAKALTETLGASYADVVIMAVANLAKSRNVGGA